MRRAKSLMAITSANTTATRPLSGSCSAIGTIDCLSEDRPRSARRDQHRDREARPQQDAGHQRRPSAPGEGSDQRRLPQLRKSDDSDERHGDRRLHGESADHRGESASEGPNRMAIGSVTTRPSSSGATSPGRHGVERRGRAGRTGRRATSIPRRLRQSIGPCAAARIVQ